MTVFENSSWIVQFGKDRYNIYVLAEDLNVDDLRGELAKMKELLARSLHEIDKSKEERKRSCGSPFIDGHFLSNVFLLTFVVIVVVSVYAFRNLYVAVLKKFPSTPQDEL